MTNRRRRYGIASVMLIIACMVWPMHCCAGGVSDRASSTYGPWESARLPEDQPSVNTACHVQNDRYGVPEAFVMKMIGLFSRYISKVDGDRCPMYPTCASYGMQAVRKHGAVIGIVMIADRLIHEGNEMDTAPLVEVDGRTRFFDPVANNDFWWYRPGKP